jgi:aminoglycoside/choline kinase family phosphotransferase
MTDPRLESARKWLADALGTSGFRLEPVSGDASFRRYFRVVDAGSSRILMDAPPENEDSRPFADVAGRLSRAGIRAPAIHAVDFDLGFALLEDFGDRLYRDLIDSQGGASRIEGLFDTLQAMANHVDSSGLPSYDHRLLEEELDLYRDWYLEWHRGRSLTEDESGDWERLKTLLIESALQQPQSFVHRDFHSSNILDLPGDRPGIIDFQDAVTGPVSYDFISLVWDRYVTWPRALIEQWMEGFRQRLSLDVSSDDWVRWCDWMGLQRNLKIIGIFCRLHYRDGKVGYRRMIPRFHRYAVDVIGRYGPLRPYAWLVEDPTCAP